MSDFDSQQSGSDAEATPLADVSAPPPAEADATPAWTPTGPALLGAGGMLPGLFVSAEAGEPAFAAKPSGDEGPSKQPAPPAPGIECFKDGIKAQGGDSAYASEGLQLDDVMAGVTDGSFFKDPAGAMQRARAHRELADKFQVVGADYDGPRNSNTITQAEYDHLCETYSDIRLGRGDLTMNTDEMCPEDAVAYRNGVMNDIGTLMQTETGRQEIEQLSHNKKVDSSLALFDSMTGMDVADTLAVHHHTTIKRRHQDTNGNKNYDDDDDQPLSQTNATTHVADGSKTAQAYLTKDGKAAGGTDEVIRFNPGVNLPHNVRDDVALAHEMVHAIHGTQGTLARDKVHEEVSTNSPDRDQTDRSEYQAVGLDRYANDALTENAYRRERHALGQNGAKGALKDDAEIERRDTYEDARTSPFDE